MRIVHVVRQYHPSCGGLEDVVRNLVLAQKSDGRDVAVVTLNRNFQNDQKLEPAAIIDGVPVHRINYIGSRKYSIAPAVLDHIVDADIVHIHAIDFFVDYLSLLKRLGSLRAKLIVSTHGGFFHTRTLIWLKKLFFRVITPFSLSGVSYVVANSHADKALFLPIFKDVIVIENGVRLHKFGAASARAANNGFLCLGRFSENKNLLNLVRWFAAACVRDRSLRLCIAGRADEENSSALLREVVRLGCVDAISIMPNPSDAQIRAAIEQCRFVVSASTHEGFGLTIPELMSYGLVPVLSEIPSFRHFVEQSGIGELFGFDEAQFVAAVQRAITRHSPAQMRRAEEFARGYSWDTVAQRFEAVYDA